MAHKHVCTVYDVHIEHIHVHVHSIKHSFLNDLLSQYKIVADMLLSSTSSSTYVVHFDLLVLCVALLLLLCS